MTKSETYYAIKRRERAAAKAQAKALAEAAKAPKKAKAAKATKATKPAASNADVTVEPATPPTEAGAEA